MRIILLSATYNPASGWGRVTDELCRRLHPKVTIELHLPSFEERLCRQVTYPVRFDLPDFAFNFRNPLRLWQYATTRLPAADLIHSLTAHPYAILAAVESRRQKIPFLIHGHGTFAVAPLQHWPDKWLLTYAYRRVNAIIAPSEFTLQVIQRQSPLPVSTHIRKVLNAVDYARFQSPDETIIKALHNRLGPGPIILSVGALKIRKGHDTLLRACALVQRIFPSLICMIIGSGSQEQCLRQLAAELSLNQVHFLRNVSDEELIAYYHLCDVFALTPCMRNWQFEGFGLVYLEAGACGKPVVGTLSGGVPDAVIDGETGLLVPPDDPQATAEAILRILENPNLAARLGENGRRRASLLTWDWFAEEILDIYGEVLGLPRSCS